MRRTVCSILGGVIDEKAGNGDLGTNVTELCDERKDHVVLLVKRPLSDLVAELVGSEVLNR